MQKTKRLVVIQNSENRANKTEGGSAPKVEIDLHQNMVDVVNMWISESRENRRAEKSFSDEQISAWSIFKSHEK